MPRCPSLCEAVPPIDPPPQYWLESDAGPSYCRDCAIVARGWEFELGPLLTTPRWYERDEWADAYWEGIDGGRDIESECAESCDRCGCTLSYILTDYGVEAEAYYHRECPLVTIRDEDSYALDRLALNVFGGMNRAHLLAVAIAVNQAYRLLPALGKEAV